MSKKITDASGEVAQTQVPTVKGVKPVGSSILVELLGQQELLNTKLYLGDAAAMKKDMAPQGYIIAVGPTVNSEWGLDVGDRVVLSGSFVPIPESLSKNGRHLAAVEPHTIKAILVE